MKAPPKRSTQKFSEFLRGPFKYMRKIKRFKIAPRQKEILRKLLRAGGLLRQAGFRSEIEVSQYILSLFSLLDPGVVYELNKDEMWELGPQNLVSQGAFSACAVTLGNKIENAVSEARAMGEPRHIVAGTIVFEFLKNAVNFITDLIREQAEKEEYETLEPQFIFLPPFATAAVPKLFREAVRLENISKDTLSAILEKLNSSKIDLALSDETLLPVYSTVFLIPWQKAKRKGKK